MSSKMLSPNGLWGPDRCFSAGDGAKRIPSNSPIIEGLLECAGGEQGSPCSGQDGQHSLRSRLFSMGSRNDGEYGRPHCLDTSTAFSYARGGGGGDGGICDRGCFF